MAKILLDLVSDTLRLKHYSYRTEETYLDWIRRYILFHQKRHPNEMRAPEIQAFLAYLASECTVAASTHTAPVVGAGGIRLSAPSFSSTAKSSTKISSQSCYPAPSALSASPRF